MGGPADSPTIEPTPSYGHVVIEVVLVVAVVAALGAASLATVMVPWAWLLVGGLSIALVGLLVGAPAGLRYHQKLRAALAAQGSIPAYWWLHPTRYHRNLDDNALARVHMPFVWGAAGFGVSMLGCTLAGIGLVRALLD